jgi:DNA invertase Pin-like site-specific DNA recombinase
LTGATKVDRIGTSVAKARKTVEAVFAMKKTKSEREVIAYLRVSNLVQAERGQSMEAQEASIREYAVSEGLIQDFNQLRVFYDRGKSAFRTKTDKRVGWGHMMNFAQKGDVIISTKLDRCFRSVSDAAMTIEMLRSKGIDLHFVDRGCVTGDSISDGLTFNILASVAAFESKLKSSRIKEVKSYMADNFMYSGGKRERGFMQQVIGGRKYLVANDLDKLLLLKVAALKKRRDKEMQETGYSRCMNDSAYSLKNVRQVIIDYAVKLGDDKQYQVEKFGEGGYMHGEDLYAWVDRAEKLFSISTLHYLVGDDENRNVYARLAKIKEVERKIKKVDGEFVLAKDKAKTTRGTVDEEGDRVNQQLSLLSAGLKSKQKVDKAISSRIVKKKAAARA